MSHSDIRNLVFFTLKNANAHELLAGFGAAARASGWTAAQIQEVMAEAISSDNHHLHRTLAKYCVKPAAN